MKDFDSATRAVAADVLEDVLGDWVPRVYHPDLPEGQRFVPASFHSHLHQQFHSREAPGGAFMSVLMALDAAAGDNFDYTEANLWPDVEAVGGIVLRAAELLRTA